MSEFEFDSTGTEETVDVTTETAEEAQPQDQDAVEAVGNDITDPDAKCPHWDDFIESVEKTGDDATEAEENLSDESVDAFQDEATNQQEQEESPPDAATNDADGEDTDCRAILLQQIYQAEMECQEREGEVEQLKEELKEKKSRYDQAVLGLRKLCLQAREKPLPLFDRPQQSTPPAATDDESDAELNAAANLWRDEPIDSLFDGIKGFGKKKLDALLEVCPTAGAFEDLRGQASREHKQFREVLPKGFGQATTDEMEERFLNWLAKYQPVDSAGESPDPEAKQEQHQDQDQQADAVSVDSGVETEADDNKEMESVEQITTRAEEINTGEDGCLDSAHPEGPKYWESGAEAHKKGWELVDCPYLPGLSQDDWIRGWLGAGEVEEWGGADVSDELAAL